MTEITKAVELNTDMSHWPTGAKHYRLGDGSYVVIEVDERDDRLDEQVNQITRLTGGAAYTYTPRPTVVIAVDENACAVSLDRLHEFEPGTSHTQALALIGP
ncbi:MULTISPECIES: DUF7572 family protein [Mycobacteroides]|uniref:DUF7572 family protein n=1 Tax=Mycobacteroides TaxID=670516 RepID=UPI0005DB63FF|nr:MULTISPECIES: hypothetical protein [Mycobacteroides]CPR84665.1 Uncharacterised protein [Mycobacteroides abscessus]CPS03161.1 Uncharacterised protein [Mycobacteroides abscessus]CPT04460.1 Uncharacterised protein [Mycobacteroides abscessus]CPU33611.1 Uncharacterised protein [Mycobacteroides abscessus]CPV12180.1 Uncharacterised protein [Mycobacteroides abscessus]